MSEPVLPRQDLCSAAGKVRGGSAPRANQSCEELLWRVGVPRQGASDASCCPPRAEAEGETTGGVERVGVVAKRVRGVDPNTSSPAGNGWVGKSTSNNHHTEAQEGVRAVTGKRERTQTIGDYRHKSRFLSC